MGKGRGWDVNWFNKWKANRRHRRYQFLEARRSVLRVEYNQLIGAELFYKSSYYTDKKIYVAKRIAAIEVEMEALSQTT